MSRLRLECVGGPRDGDRLSVDPLFDEVQVQMLFLGEPVGAPISPIAPPMEVGIYRIRTWRRQVSRPGETLTIDQDCLFWEGVR